MFRSIRSAYCGSRAKWCYEKKNSKCGAAAPISCDSSIIAPGLGPKGQPLWQTYLYGVGPVSHSRYRNDVQIQVLDKDRIVVFGAESGGKYVEVLDAGTGADLGVRPE